MHPPLQELADLLDRERAALLAARARVPPADRERRPAPDVWSPAELLEHLRLVEAGSARLLARRLERAREAGLGPETDPRSRLGAAALADLADDAERKTAPEPVAPPAGVRAADAEAGLAATREQLRALLAAADGLALGRVRATHLRFGELDFYAWLEFLALHERRHVRQMERLGRASGAARAD